MFGNALEHSKDLWDTAHSEARARAKRLNVKGGESIFGIDELAALSQAAAQIAIAEHLAGILEKLSNIDSTLWDARGPDGSIKGAQ